ncbi:MAG: hypothetical protein EAZ09_08020 [Oscillatoriales cyanobacterium]|nr:MAG: hypothetical protein EAZ18_01760 [Oscillatoriales cyanobacterium]TAH23295.1 MAG: hypothetical protein EAZ09_08020 [Oscillatoriales cyanobacterium]
MNNLFSKSTFALVNLVALAVCCSALSVKAETGNLLDAVTTASLPSEATPALSEPAVTKPAQANAETTANTQIDSISAIELDAAVQSGLAVAKPAASQPATNLQASAVAPEKSDVANSAIVATENTSIAGETKKSETATTIADGSVKVQPSVEIATDVARDNSELTAANVEKEVKTAQEVLSNPVSTSASALTKEPTTAEKSEISSAPTQKVAQDNKVRPGRSTRSGPSYIGIGGNLGFGGDTALGDSSFAIISKIGLTSNFSVRPTVLFRDNVTVLIPVTYDFVSQNAVEVSDDFVITAAPYAGAGVAFSTGDDSHFGFLISGGVDVPLSSNFTATAGLNIGFLDGAEVGLLLGVGYTFPNIVR